MAFRSIKIKVLTYFLAAAVVIIGVYGIVTYNLVRHDLEKEIEKRLVVVGNFIKEAVDPDDINVLSYRGKVYKKYADKLLYLKEITEVDDIMIINADRKPVLSLVEEKEEFFIMLDDFELKKAMEGKVTSSPLYVGVKGKYYKTAYVPLFSGGRVAGVIGVEASVAYVNYMNQYKKALSVAGAALLILAFILSVLISSGITRSTIQLKKKAEQIAKRNFDENIKVSGEEEINVLADTLDAMKTELREYISTRERMATVGEFSAGVAHEIRNSLNVVSGYAELIKENAADKKIKKKAGDIVKNTMKMSEFLNNFLDYTKDFVPEYQDVELSAFMDELLEELPRDVVVSVRREYEGKNALIRADVYLIKKAFYNIIMNAYQSIRQEEKIIAIDIKLGSGEKSAAVIISDNGSGIEAELKDKIFQPFFTGKKEGTGIGLAIAYKIVKEIHGGDIKVKSDKGRGTEFTVIFKSR